MDKNKLINLPNIKLFATRKEWEEACWQKIVDSPEIIGLLAAASERHNLVLRVAAMNELLVGKSYREIGDSLWLSPQTISGIKKILDGEKYKSYTERFRLEGRKDKYSSGTIQAAGVSAKKRIGRIQKTKYGTLHHPS